MRATASFPTRCRARIAGTFSEYWSAWRTRTGPRSSWSPSRGDQSSRTLNLVVTSRRRLPGRQPLVVEGARVHDRLEGGTGLAQPVARRVVLRGELAAGQIVPRVSRAADVGEDVAGPIVERDECAVVEILATEGVDPAPVARRDLELGEEAVRLSGRQVRDDRCRGHPALGELLRLPVERRDDGVAAGVRRLRVTEDAIELAADLPGELAGLVRERFVAGEDDRFGQGGLQLGGREMRPSAALGGEPVEDPVATLRRRRVGRHDQAALGVRFREVVGIERRRRLRQAGQERRLGRGQLGEVRDAEVRLRRGGDAVRAVSVEDLVQIGRDDLLLAGLRPGMPR